MVEIYVLTSDPGFFTVVHGLGGATGHAAFNASDRESRVVPAKALFIVDGHTAAEAVGAYTFDTTRTVGFIPAAGDPGGRLRAAGVARSFPRATLAEELPRLFAEFAV